MGSGTLEGALAHALDFASSIGVRVPETGRHRAALKFLDQFNTSRRKVRSATADQLRRLSAVHRTAWEALLIICAASISRRRRWTPTPFPIDKLNLIIGGREATEGRDSRARDAQFELYVAGMLTLASLDVRGGEPDLKFQYGYEIVGVAAKRIRSTEPNQVRRNVSLAVDQIDTSGLRGWLAINLDARFTSILPGRRGRARLQREFNAAFNSLDEALRPYISNRQYSV
jgi:hypothetical protein